VHYASVPLVLKDKSLNGRYSKWFVNQNEIAETPETVYTFDTPGRYEITLEIEEGALLIEEIIILPALPIPYLPGSAEYSGDFETDKGHFAAWTVQGSSWERGRSDYNF
jgi:hypothetical protein